MFGARNPVGPGAVYRLRARTLFPMISLFFGLPGSGKTSLMVSRMIKYHRKHPKLNIFCNVPVSLDYVTFIKNSDIGLFDISNGCLFIDEASLFADSRDYKNFDRQKVQFFLLHRHYKVDIELYTQQWDAVDKKIRVITDKVFYVYKLRLIPSLTKYYRIPYGIIIPDPKKDDSQKLGEIVQGYCKPNFLIRLFSPVLFRRSVYKYFDSWDAPPLPPLPETLP